MKLEEAQYKILIYGVSKIQPPIHYILGDMIPPSLGSSLFQDSSLNRTPGENCYILGYKGPNEISEDVPELSQNLVSVFQVLDPEYETVTRGSPYNLPMLNSPERGHIGKMIISPNW